MKIAVFIQALELVGRIYRNKDGSQPAEAVRKIRQQLEGASDMTSGRVGRGEAICVKAEVQAPGQSENG